MRYLKRFITEGESYW